MRVKCKQRKGEGRVEKKSPLGGMKNTLLKIIHVNYHGIAICNAL
jgi:hypothetical protein